MKRRGTAEQPTLAQLDLPDLLSRCKGTHRPIGRDGLGGARGEPASSLTSVRMRARHPGAGCGCRLRWGGEQGAEPGAHCAQRCAAPAVPEAWVEVGAAAAALQLTRCLSSALHF